MQVFLMRRVAFRVEHGGEIEAGSRGDGALERALNRLQAAILQTRRRPELAVAVARQALLGLAVESARLNRR